MNQPCAYVPYSFSTFFLQCIKIEETGIAPKEFIEPSTHELDSSSSKISIFLIWISDLSLSIVYFQCKSCSKTHLFDTFQGCNQHNSPTASPYFPSDWVWSTTPTGWEEGPSKIPDTSLLPKNSIIDVGKFFINYF